MEKKWIPAVPSLYFIYLIAKDLINWIMEKYPMNIEIFVFRIILILSICYLIFLISHFLWNLNRKMNDLKEWIGLPSYKGLYSNLKGKIKVYIREELEKESTERKKIDTATADKLFHLSSEIEDIRITVPRRTIKNKIE